MCGVSPYNGDYKAFKVIPILHAANNLQSSDTCQTYMLVLLEEIWMGYTLDHALVNLNQLYHYGTRFQYKPMSESPLSSIT